VIEAVVPVLEASGGRAFLLFTSHRALREAAERLNGRLPYPLLIQGEAPRAELLERFRRLGNAVLLGTGSFWEGVDVRGDTLSCVVVDKLPFAAPDDPVLQASLAVIREEGGNPFMDYQLPQAVVALKQGFGRLIRDAQDRGVLVLCDPRLLTRSYGRIFLRSLPPMPLTRDLSRVLEFFAPPADPTPEPGTAGTRAGPSP
jgi:ATP-dependent DNA helicase DinG